MHKVGRVAFYAWGVGMILSAAVAIVREWRSAESSECTSSYDVGESGVYVSELECPEDRDGADEARGGY
jgi:hypothetical protein